jgi:hypothetical protein
MRYAASNWRTMSGMSVKLTMSAESVLVVAQMNSFHDSNAVIHNALLQQFFCLPLERAVSSASCNGAVACGIELYVQRLLPHRRNVGQPHAVGGQHSGQRMYNTRVIASASATRQACCPAAPPKQHSVYSVTSWPRCTEICLIAFAMLPTAMSI